MRRWRNFLILLNRWRLVEMCYKIVNDPKSNWSAGKVQDMTMEEIQGIEDLHTVERLLTMNPKKLKKELKHLGDSLH